MTPLCWERLRTGYIHLVLRQKGWPPEAEKHHNSQELSTHQPASTWVTQICFFKLVQARLHRHLAVVILKLRTYDCPHEGLPPMHGANLSGWIVSFRRKSIQNFMAHHHSSQYATIYPNAIGTTEHGYTNVCEEIKKYEKHTARY